jgi:hypothetical protein
MDDNIDDNDDDGDGVTGNNDDGKCAKQQSRQ